MHTHTKSIFYKRLLLAIITTVLPTITFAAAPSPVLDLNVEYNKGQVIVSWTKVPEADVVNYKVYFSTESILENNGSYDDFVETNGNKAEYIFTNLPPNQKKYFAVLAVNSAKEESLGFAKEVSIMVPENTTTDNEFNLPVKEQFPVSSSSQASSKKAIETSTVSLISAEAISPTEVKLLFSGQIDIAAEDAPKAFSITDTMNQKLGLISLAINGDDVRLKTKEQIKDMVYLLKVSEPLMGYKNNKPLDEAARQVFFVGHKDSTVREENTINTTTQTSSINSSQATSMVGEIKNVTMTKTKNVGNTSTVDIAWEPPVNDNTISYYLVSQTFDNQQTFTEAQMIPVEYGGVQIPGIKSAWVGIKVQVVNTSGYISNGVIVSQPVAAIMNGSVINTVSSTTGNNPTTTYVPNTRPITANVSQAIGKGTIETLPSSGESPLVWAYVLIGAMAGYMYMKKHSSITYKNS